MQKFVGILTTFTTENKTFTDKSRYLENNGKII